MVLQVDSFHPLQIFKKILIILLVKDLEGAPKTPCVREARPRLCLLRSLLDRAARLLLLPALYVVVLPACARACVAVGHPAVFWIDGACFMQRSSCLFVLSFDTHKLRKAMDMEQVSINRSNEGKDVLLLSRFDEGDAGGGDRHRRSSATNFCHSHLPVKNERYQ